MNRKEFLASILALGGSAALSPTGASVLHELSDLADEELQRKSLARNTIDPSKIVMLADIHICGELRDGTPIHYPYNPTCLKLRIAEILAMRPLPAHVLVFGDVAWDYGLEEDYRYAAELLRPLEQAGIKVTLGLGNHDRRNAFFKVFEEYGRNTQVEGRAVSVVNLPDVDIIILDSLDEQPNLKPRQATTVKGSVDATQIEWLKGYLSTATHPVILGAHHPLGEMPALAKVITSSQAVKGYIYGHTHIWSKSAHILRPRSPQRMIPTVGLPATFYGDIGFAVMTTSPEGAHIEYSSKGFWWPQPTTNPPAEWQARQNDLACERCTILF